MAQVLVAQMLVAQALLSTFKVLGEAVASPIPGNFILFYLVVYNLSYVQEAFSFGFYHFGFSAFR
jgi:hypothetical protein